MTNKPLADLLCGVRAYHEFLAANPDKALTAPAWRDLTNAAQVRWRERAAPKKASGVDELKASMDEMAKHLMRAPKR